MGGQSELGCELSTGFYTLFLAWVLGANITQLYVIPTLDSGERSSDLTRTEIYISTINVKVKW